MVAKRAKLSKSLEDYLEAVLFCVRRRRVARVRDLARRLGVNNSSVTAALKSLAERDLVNYDPYEVITLTDRGREAAEEIQHRHDVLRGLLTEVLGVDAAAADDYACRLEHAVDAALLERLDRFMAFARRRGGDWLDAFRRHCANGRRQTQAGRRRAGRKRPARKATGNRR